MQLCLSVCSYLFRQFVIYLCIDSVVYVFHCFCISSFLPFFLRSFFLSLVNSVFVQFGFVRSFFIQLVCYFFSYLVRSFVLSLALAFLMCYFVCVLVSRFLYVFHYFVCYPFSRALFLYVFLQFVCYVFRYFISDFGRYVFLYVFVQLCFVFFIDIFCYFVIQFFHYLVISSVVQFLCFSMCFFLSVVRSFSRSLFYDVFSLFIYCCFALGIYFFRYVVRSFFLPVGCLQFVIYVVRQCVLCWYVFRRYLCMVLVLCFFRPLFISCVLQRLVFLY